jgi:Na+/melibiose symporter-like transporter
MGRGRRQFLPPAGSRALVLSDLLSTIGTGLFITGGVLFFTEAVGLSIVRTSVMLTCAGTVGFLTTVPLGHLADRIGPREVSLILLAARAIATGSLVMFHDLAALWVATTVMMVGDRGLIATFGALTAAVGGPERVRVQGYLRAVTNIGLSVGSLTAAPFLAVGGAGSYHVLLLTNAGVLAAAALALLGVRHVEPVREQDRSPAWTALRDRRYLKVTLLHGVLGLQSEMLAYGLPLWVVYGTDAPHWMVAVLLTTNTILVAACQVPVSARVRTIADAVVVGRRSGLVFLFSAAILASAHWSGGMMTVGLLLAAVLVHTVGELWQAASAFLLSFDLAQEHAHGQYQGVFALGRGLKRAIAPALLGLLCLRWGPPGWLLLGMTLAIVARGLPRAVAGPDRTQALPDQEMSDHDLADRGAR